MYHRMECKKSICCIGVDFACRRCGTMVRGEGWDLPMATDGGRSILVCGDCRDAYERSAVFAAEAACMAFVSDTVAS